MWSTLALFLLFGAVIGTSATVCVPYTLPTKGECTHTVDWKVNDDKHALATCLEYFPTTFVKGERDDNGKAKCTVTAAYTCVHVEKALKEKALKEKALKGSHDEDDEVPDVEVFLMYDKCYIFPKKNGKYVKGTIDDYKTKGLCDGGKLSVFYSYTQAKFLGMKANKLNIDKLWIGIDSEGRMIEGDKEMMHKTLWKLVDGDYWKGDQLIKVTEKDKDEKYIYPAEAKYYFLRTRTDYVMNRIQGSFERTADDMEATFACEFESKFNAEQGWYCDKLNKLGIASVYDTKNPASPRCLYATANKYSYKGNAEDMKNIKGCQEVPSDLYSAGMDDGTADPESYKTLNKKGAMRIAAYLEPDVVDAPTKQQKCKGVASAAEREKYWRQWRQLDHNGKKQLPTAAKMSWDQKYPLNECSDFPGSSTTMGLRNGLKIDMPPEVRAKAICSLRFFQECENKKPCGKQFECTNTNIFQPETAGFFTCTCPGEGVAHKKENDGTCSWIPGNEWCAWFMFAQTVEGLGADAAFPANADQSIGEDYIGKSSTKDWARNDGLFKAIVRDGCKLSVYAGRPGTFALLNEAGYGTHDVPQTAKGTLGKDFEGQGASWATCYC